MMPGMAPMNMAGGIPPHMMGMNGVPSHMGMPMGMPRMSMNGPDGVFGGILITMPDILDLDLYEVLLIDLVTVEYKVIKERI